MGMFDSFFVHGKVKDVVNGIIPGTDGEFQTKELDLELCRYHIGDDFILKIDDRPWERHPGLEEFEIIKAGNFTRLIEDRWSANDGSVLLNFVNNRLTFIAHIHCFGWFPIPHPRAKDKVIFFDEDEILVVELDHEAKDVDQRALDTYYQIMKSEIYRDTDQLKLALENYYSFRNTPDPVPGRLQVANSKREMCLQYFHQYIKNNPFTGITEMLSPIAIALMLHNEWLKTQTENYMQYIIAPDFTHHGFDGRFPQDLLHIFEASWASVIGEVKPQKSRPNRDFSSVHYGD